MLLAADARSLLAAGADIVLLCTNTMHTVADVVPAGLDVPLLHIGDSTAGAITAAGLTRVGLLGTRYTMEQPFLTDRLIAAGLEVVVPEPADRDLVHRVIYEELVVGVVRDESRQAYREVVDRLVARGAQGVVLGCTEIELLVGPDDVDVPTSRRRRCTWPRPCAPRWRTEQAPELVCLQRKCAVDPVG